MAVLPRPVAGHADTQPLPDTPGSTAPPGSEVPVRADGVQLLGEMEGSGYREPPALVRHQPPILAADDTPARDGRVVGSPGTVRAISSGRGVDVGWRPPRGGQRGSLCRWPLAHHRSSRGRFAWCWDSGSAGKMTDMASLQTLERRILALEARLADVEGGYGDTLFKLHRGSVKAELRTAKDLGTPRDPGRDR